jgi:hypothetical protein
MNEHQRRLALQTRLKTLHENMLTPAYQARVDGLSVDEQEKAALLFYKVYWTYNRVRTQVLSSIRKQLEESSEPLEAAIVRMDAAIKKIEQASKFISEVSGILDELKSLLSFLT